jgi:hypothetical protein
MAKPSTERLWASSAGNLAKRQATQNEGSSAVNTMASSAGNLAERQATQNEGSSAVNTLASSTCNLAERQATQKEVSSTVNAKNNEKAQSNGDDPPPMKARFAPRLDQHHVPRAADGQQLPSHADDTSNSYDTDDIVPKQV